MSIFLTEHQKKSIYEQCSCNPHLHDMYWVLYNRAKRCASRPGIIEMSDTSDWWYSCFDYLSNAAMFCALKPDDELSAYVRDSTLSLIRRSAKEWCGPWFRGINTNEPLAYLETAHLIWATASALDLAPEVFSTTEREEVAACLRERAIGMCRRGLDVKTRPGQNNWMCIMSGGLAVAAAVTGQQTEMEYAASQYNMLCGLYQPDGSYCESLQYSNYAQIGLFLAYEALVGANPAFTQRMHPDAYAKGMRWVAASYLYHSPQEGWGAQPRARFANFNDSAAIFRPTGDVLLHIAARCKEALPVEAGLARWLFDRCYAIANDGPTDLASFGFNNITGFLTLPLLLNACPPLSPAQAGLKTTESFDCGDAILRDKWEGKTVVAIRGGAEVKHVQSHTHADLNSFILAHNHERLLIDPGHSCYRGDLHELEVQTRQHNACTFLMKHADKEALLQQTIPDYYRQAPQPGVLDAALPGLSKKLLCEIADDWSIAGYDNTAAYGTPLLQSTRFWFFHPAGALFVVDMMRSTTPLRPVWNWALNNHSGLLEYKALPPDRIVARRNNAGMKLFHCAGGTLSGPRYGVAHDSYHLLPAQKGEGISGSAWHICWTLPHPVTEHICIHAIAVDSYGEIARWHLTESGANLATLNKGQTGVFRVHVNTAEDITLTSGSQNLHVLAKNGQWTIQS